MRTPIGTAVIGPYYRDVHTSEASGVFPVGVALHTRDVERYKAMLKSSLFLLVDKNN